MAIQKLDKNKLIEGRGMIDLSKPENYLPWIKTNEFTKCQGTRYSIKDMFNGRSIHLMSGLERDYYYITRWDSKVIEIFEQYPLFPVETTIDISNKLGYQYPKRTYKNELFTMTTDFLILAKDKNAKLKWFARSIKPKSDLNKIRVREKLKIEQMYWENKGVHWSVITEDNINTVKADNIQLISQGLYDGKNNTVDFKRFNYE